MAVGKLKLHIAENNEEDPECIDDDIVADISLPAHPGRGISGVIAKHVRLRDLVGDNGRADVYLDFDHAGQLIGIEVLT